MSNFRDFDLSDCLIVETGFQRAECVCALLTSRFKQQKAKNTERMEQLFSDIQKENKQIAKFAKKKTGTTESGDRAKQFFNCAICKTARRKCRL